jgi:hypothetical protein
MRADPQRLPLAGRVQGDHVGDHPDRQPRVVDQEFAVPYRDSQAAQRERQQDRERQQHRVRQPAGKLGDAERQLGRQDGTDQQARRPRPPR